MDEQKFYSPAEAGRILGVSFQTIKNWIKKYGIPCERTNCGYYKLTNDNIEQIREILKGKYGIS